MKNKYHPGLALLMSIFLTSAHLFAAPKDLSLPGHPVDSRKSTRLDIEAKRSRPSKSNPLDLEDTKKSSANNEDRPHSSNDNSALQLGNSSGGGNDKVVTADGTPRLASEYVSLFEDVKIEDHLPSSKPYTIPANVRQEMAKLQRILHSTQLHDDSERFDAMGMSYASEDDFIGTEILAGEIKLLLVDEIPDGTKDPIFSQCENVTRRASLPDHAKRSRSACTLYSTPYTLMVQSDFESPADASAELRFQALSLAHEGLRRRGIPDQDVSRIDQALALALDLLNEQLHGKRRALTSDEQNKLQWLLRLSYQYSLASRNQAHFPSWLTNAKVWKNGGGYVRIERLRGESDETLQPSIDETAFIGIAVAIPTPHIPPHVVLIDTDICQVQECIFQEGVHVINARIHLGSIDRGTMTVQHPARIFARAHVENVVATKVTRFDVGGDAHVSDSRMQDGEVRIWPNAEVHNVDIHYSVAPHPAEGLALKQYFELSVGTNARLENINLSAGIPLKLSPNSSFGFASGRPAFWIVRGHQGVFQQTDNIGLTVKPSTKINLSEFAKICRNQDGISRVEGFSESVISDQGLQQLCMQKPPANQLNY